MNFLNEKLLDTYPYLFYIDLIILLLFILTSIFLFLDYFLSENNYKDGIYDSSFLMFFFSLGYLIYR